MADRRYNKTGSTDRYQVFYRSCTRGPPYELCLENSKGPVVDTKGVKHLNDVRPLMMYDPYGRIVHLEFVPTDQYNSRLRVPETKLVVRLIKDGPRGYSLARNQCYPRKWGARHDNLDDYRNSNLGLYEVPNAFQLQKKKQMETNRREHLGEGAGPYFTVDGEMETWVRTNRTSTFDTMNDDGLTRRDLDDTYDETFSDFATWIDVRHFKRPSEVRPGYFDDDFGVIQIGQDLSCAPGGISTFNGESIGLPSVTFTDVSCPAYTIIGPVYQHLFVDKLDMVADMRILMQKMKGFGKELVVYVIRNARQRQRHHWTDFDECFELDGQWKHVVGPIRSFLVTGGRLDDQDAVFAALEGASMEKKESLFVQAKKRNLQTISDFKIDQRKSYAHFLFQF